MLPIARYQALTLFAKSRFTKVLFVLTKRLRKQIIDFLSRSNSGDIPMKITPWPLLPGLVMGLCLFAASARADTIYTYTGNPFTVFSGLDACPPVCNISGSFTLASPLAANLPFEAITPTAFSFTDGSVTVTEGASEASRSLCWRIQHLHLLGYSTWASKQVSTNHGDSMQGFTSESNARRTALTGCVWAALASLTRVGSGAMLLVGQERSTQYAALAAEPGCASDFSSATP
jgi:hypothetical protein